MIKRIEINNFKSLKDVSFDVPKFAVLVGYNGSGKTNYVKALHLVSLLAKGVKIEEALKSLDLLSRELFFNPEFKQVKFSFELVINGRPLNYSFSIGQSLKGGGLVYEIIEEELVNGSKEKPLLERKNTLVKTYSDEDHEFIENQLVSNQLALSFFEKPQPVADVKNVLSSIVVSQLDQEYLTNMGINTNIDGDAPKSLTESLFKLKQADIESYNEFLRESKRIIKGLSNIEISQHNDRLLLNFSEESSGKQFTSYSASDGNLRTFAILNNIFAKNKPSILVIDEIENSFHPARIKSLMDMLKYISSTNDGKLQIIITTHSPIVLNTVSFDEVVYVYKKDGETKIQNPYKDKTVRKHLEMSEDGGVKLGELFSDGMLEEIFSNII